MVEGVSIKEELNKLWNKKSTELHEKCVQASLEYNYPNNITAQNAMRVAEGLTPLPQEPKEDIPEIKPELKIPSTGKLASHFSEEIAKILATKNTIFYRPDLMEVVEIKSIRDNNGNVQDAGFITIKPSRFITLIENYIKPYTMVKIPYQGFEKKEKSLGSDMAATVLQSPQMQNILPHIKRIFTIPIPIIYQGKLTFPCNGYDYRFDSWLPYDAPKIENPEMPVELAKNIIEDIYKEFCFQTRQDYVNAVAGLLTPFLRGIFKKFNTRTPIFFYLANRERAGKDYCAGVTGMLYEGCALEEPPICSAEEKGINTNNTEELRKKILSAFISGRKRLHFANNKGHIDNSILEAVITAEKHSDRMLGRNENLVFDNELDFSASGNVGISFTPDLANRMRIIRLFLEIEDANQRKFNNPNLHNFVKENRGLILSALYALVRNWVEKGMPKGTKLYSSFPQWAEICGGIMECAGYDSPCTQDKETLGISGDAETSDMKQLFEMCYERFPEEWITKNMVKGIVTSDEGIFTYLDFDKKADQIKFAKKLTKFYGRLLSDIQLLVKDPTVRAARQELMFTKKKEEKKENIFEFGNIGNIGNISLPKILTPTL